MEVMIKGEKMNFIEIISPSYAAKRERAKTELKLEKARAGWIEEYVGYSQHGASKKKAAFKKFDDNLYNADEDIGDNKEVLMARSRQLYMGNPIAVSAIRKFRTNIVGSGIKLKSKINNKILNLSEDEVQQIQDNIQTVWELWAESKECDIERQSNFYQIQSLALITQLIDGECFAVLPLKKRVNEFFELKIKLIDSARCTSPNLPNENIRNGVELDKDGEPIAYWFIKNEETMEPIRIHTFSKTGRRNVLVMMEKERIGQRRGVPVLAPVIEMLSQLSKFTNAELMNAVISSMFTAFIKTEKNTNPVGQMLGATITDKKDTENEGKFIEMGSGTIVDLEPGQDLVFADPNRPNTQFEAFMIAMCKEVGAALEIPLEVLLSNFNASYSASKASLEEVWKVYMMRRTWLISDFCQPIFEEFMDEAVAKGYLKLKGYYENPLMRKAYITAEWYGEAQSQIDPLKEVKAANERISNGLSTRARESRAINGSDWKKNVEQLKVENKIMKELRENENNGE